MKYLVLLLALAACAPVDHRDTARVYVNGILVMTTRIDTNHDQVIHPPVLAGCTDIRVEVSDEHGIIWEVGTAISDLTPGGAETLALHWTVLH